MVPGWRLTVEPACRSPFSQIPVILQAPPFKRFGHGRREFTPWKLPYAANQGYFSEACLLLCHWFPPSAIPPRQHGGRSLTSGSSFSLSLQPQTQARPLSLLGSALGSPPPGLARLSFCPILLGNTPAFRWWGGGLFSLVLQAPFGQMAAGGGSLLLGAAGLWSVGGEGALLFGAAGPLGLPTGVPSLAPSAPSHRIPPWPPRPTSRCPDFMPFPS